MKRNGLHWVPPILALTAGVAGMAALWTTLALFGDRPQGWLAMVAAVDMVVLLRISGAPAGRARMSAAALATLLATAVTAWMVVSTRYGQMLGLKPFESALRLGPVLAWEVTRLAASRWDIAFVLVGPALAAWWSRPPKKPSPH